LFEDAAVARDVQSPKIDRTILLFLPKITGRYPLCGINGTRCSIMCAALEMEAFGFMKVNRSAFQVPEFPVAFLIKSIYFFIF